MAGMDNTSHRMIEYKLIYQRIVQWAQQFFIIKTMSVLDSFAKLRKATITFFISVLPPVCLFAWNNSAPTGGIFLKFDIWGFCRNSVEKIMFNWNLTRITDTLHEDRYTFMIICPSVLLRLENISNKIWRESQNTHFMFSKFFR